MNADRILKLANENYGENSENLTAVDLADFAKFVLDMQAREEMILARRHACNRAGHVFHWPGQTYEIGITEMGSGGVTVNGWKADVQQCQNCDGILGVHYGEMK